MKTNNNHIEDDQLLKDLFKEFEPEEATPSIRTNVMNRVLHDWVEKPQNYQPLINRSNRWWIISAATLALIIAFLVDASVIQQYFNSLGIDTNIINLSAINQNLKQSFSIAAKIPSLIYFVAVGIIFLLGIDKILNRLANL